MDGFNGNIGSSASSTGQVPKALNPSLHVPTAFGRDSSTSEPAFGPATAASVPGTRGAVGAFRSAQAPPKVAERTTLSIVRIVFIVPPIPKSSVQRFRG